MRFGPLSMLRRRTPADAHARARAHTRAHAHAHAARPRLRLIHPPDEAPPAPPAARSARPTRPACSCRARLRYPDQRRASRANGLPPVGGMRPPSPAPSRGRHLPRRRRLGPRAARSRARGRCGSPTPGPRPAARQWLRSPEQRHDQRRPAVAAGRDPDRSPGVEQHLRERRLVAVGRLSRAGQLLNPCSRAITVRAPSDVSGASYRANAAAAPAVPSRADASSPSALPSWYPGSSRYGC